MRIQSVELPLAAGPLMGRGVPAGVGVQPGNSDGGVAPALHSPEARRRATPLTQASVKLLVRATWRARQGSNLQPSA